MSLPRWEHDAWHRLVNHMYPTTAAQQLTEWNLFPGFRFVAKRRHKAVFPDLSGLDCVINERVRPEMSEVQRRTWRLLCRVWSRRGIDMGNPVAFARHVSTRFFDRDYIICVEKLAKKSMEDTVVHPRAAP